MSFIYYLQRRPIFPEKKRKYKEQTFFILLYLFICSLTSPMYHLYSLWLLDSEWKVSLYNKTVFL